MEAIEDAVDTVLVLLDRRFSANRWISSRVGSWDSMWDQSVVTLFSGLT